MGLTIYNGFGVKKEYEIPENTIKKSPWEFYCHRGYTISGVPLNTIPTIHAVRENGYIWTEIDIRTTSDGVLILCHDATITGTDSSGTSQTLTIAESTLADIQALALATHATYGTITAPTLDAVLDMAAFTGLNLVLDIKAAACEAVAHAVLAHSMQGRVVYNTQSNTANATAVLAIDKLAKFNFDYPSTGDCSAIMEVVGGNASKINLAVSAASENLAELADGAKAAGGNLYIWNVTPALYPACADCAPAILEFQSGREAQAAMTAAIADYVDAKTWW